MEQSEPMKRLITPIPAELVEAIDEYWHENRLRNRSEAVRQLLAIALGHKPRSDKVSRK
jgi:metal-responsive CopG/Arc/MetJ family transcriptional regulator